ncbi:hypothetical protein J0871_17160 [Salegentibacter sp. BDJ18]|uniref:CU044_2847 family protein n=1 Tax=Salegentibacter sp. BDJ18 TaxID=2816376 RepID=UPI001AAFD274|nr:CU044_2847 family protein [Salegentibacter sp. BDJ18]MBO2546148.1 hypothetical protein [Salegentibacter sp. BDJ18]
MNAKKKTNQKKPVDFYIQVGGNPNSSITPQASIQDFVEGSKEQLKKITSVIEIAGEAIIENINQFSSKPSECSIEFGINVASEGGVPLITKGTIGANFKVNVTWKP